MSAKQNELDIPPDIAGDPQAQEILRLWIGGGEPHVTIAAGMNGGPAGFGEMLFDLARHGALMFSERDGISAFEALARIRTELDDLWTSEPPWPTGQIDGED